jgi:Sensors of blue-light using FAD
MLSQLVYVSNRKANCTEAEIEKILASCKKNNPPLNITGVLLYSDIKFIQLVEGEYKVIRVC